MNQKHRSAYLFNKYLKNECDEIEFRELMMLLKESRDIHDFDEQLNAVWNRWEQEPTEPVVDWDRMYPAAASGEVAKPLRTNVFLRYAAVIILLILSSLAIYNLSSERRAATAAFLTAHTQSLKTIVVLLEDGTKVTLNANSTLKFPEKFIGPTREVFLKGEAYFEVAHNRKKPFIVHSGRLKTQVIGTTFTVSSYSAKALSEVTVLSGKVSVKDNVTKAATYLTRGQKAAIKQGLKNFSLTTLTSPDETIAWIDGKIVFENATIEEIVQKLSSHYGIEVQVINNTIGQKRITAIFQNQSLPSILNALTQLTNSEYKLQTNSYIMY